MKVVGLVSVLAATIAATVATLPIAAPAVAGPGGGNLSTSCSPIGDGWVRCTTTFCTAAGCVVVESWNARVGEAIVHQ